MNEEQHEQESAGECSVGDVIHEGPVENALRRAPGPSPAKRLVKFVYRNNPFYLISACFVLYGLHRFFHTSDKSTSVWILMSVLAAYSVLMAATGALIVRFGKVWDDARSILLITVVLFMAMAMSLDEVAVRNPDLANPFLIAGLLLTIVVTEGVMRWTRIRLAPLYRVSYHAFFGLFFLYPIFMQPLRDISNEANRAPISWGLLAFPYAVAAIFLMLIPAIRKGGAYVRDNGTPWRWPAFPWMLFGLLGVAAAFRSYYLTFTMYPGLEMRTPFSGYFLLPLLLTGAVLVLEAALATGRTSLKWLALALPMVALALSFPGRPVGRDETEFLEVVQFAVGSPVFIAASLIAVFYAYAWLRGVAGAEAGFLVALLTVSAAGPQTVSLATLTRPATECWMLAVAIEFVLACLRRTSWRVALASMLGLGGVTWWINGTAFTIGGGVIPLHLGLLVLMAIGAVYRDRFGLAVQKATAVAIPVVGCYGVFWSSRMGETPGWLVPACLLTLSIAAVAYAILLRQRLYLIGAALDLALLILRVGMDLHAMTSRHRMPEGLTPLIWGGLFFLIAALISLAKAGITRRGGNALRHLTEIAKPAITTPPED